MNSPAVASRMNAFVTSDDDTTTGGESRARRPIPSYPSNSDLSLNSRMSQTASTLAMANAKTSSFTPRKSSARDYKAPLGPRPLNSTSKRVVSDAPLVAPSLQSRSFLPTSTSDTFLASPSRRRNTAYDFIMPSAPNVNGSEGMRRSNGASELDERDSYNDDSHNAVLRGDFPMPEAGVRKMSGYEFGTFGNSEHHSNQRNTMNNLPTPTLSTAESSGTSRSSSRYLSGAKRAAQLSVASSSSSSSAAPQFRTRRSSLFPVTTNTNATSRPPRKSVGSGMVAGSGTERPALGASVRTSLSSASNAANMRLNHEISKARARLSPQGPGAKAENMAPPSTELRPRVQSLQAPSYGSSNKYTDRFSSLSETARQTVTNSRTPGRPTNQQTTTPSSTTRQSSYNAQNSHMGGLGARTVSPTDARRMRRLSTVNPKRPQNPPTPDAQSGSMPFNENVPPMPRNRATPAPAAETPDPSRNDTERPISSRSSYSSCRPISSSAQVRPGLTIPAKSPTFAVSPLKSPADNEMVPPVPAIPKGYSSPNDQFDHTLFSNDIVQDDKAYPEIEKAPTLSSSRTSWLENRQKRTLVLGSRSDGTKQNNGQKGVRSSQPLRLPPLNIVPLSNSSTSRTLTESRRSPPELNGSLTPPPKRSTLRTPVTPMTASKATFATNTFSYGDLLGSLPFLRSSTSHEEPWMRSDTPRDIDDNSPLKDVDHSPALSESTQFPPLSSTLKEQIDPGYIKAKENEVNSNYELADESRGSRFSTFRNQFSGKSSKELRAAQNLNATQAEQSPAPVPLRRKMSLGWRRSSSKASHVDQQNDDDLASPVPKTSDRHPPRLELSTSSKDQIRLSSILNHGISDKAASQSLSTTSAEAVSKESDNVEKTLRKERSADPEHLYRDERLDLAKKSRDSSNPPLRQSSSQFLSRSSVPRPDSKLDRDDQAAEDEMQRLASKRKDFEAAAKEVDELKRRAVPKERLSPTQAARMTNLNIFERGEVIDYKEVYFCGNKTAKKFVGDLNAHASNYGFDDDRGDYNLVMGDHLAYRYEVVDMLGKGSFGQVVRCVDHKSGKLVAIKIIRNKKRFHQQALVEVNILQKLRDWDPHCRHSMINFTQSFYFRGHLCISTELLGMNLYELIKAHEFRGFSLKIIRRFTKQLLSSLVLLQSRRVIHCDLKPENILLAHPLHAEIKVIDFGSSCFENEKVYTYIQSRFYRSPEVILGMTYGLPIDMWSVGCILAELLTGYPIFPGENEQEQLACIMEVFGPPEKHLIEKSTRKKLFFDSLGKPRITVSSKGKRRRPSSKTLQQALKCDDDAFLDFISRCLRWDPDRRLKPDDAMNHPFVTGIRKTSRPRPSGASSPVKRAGPAPTPSRARPLPEPPASGFKNRGASSGLSNTQPSPTKTSTGRRHSTVNGLTNSAPSKKPVANAAAIGLLTGIPRAPPRSASGRPDLASAAAIASLVRP